MSNGIKHRLHTKVKYDILEWFAERKTCNVPVSRLLLNKKAGDLARLLNIAGFKTTKGI